MDTWTTEAKARADLIGTVLELSGFIFGLMLALQMSLGFMEIYHHTWNRANLFLSGISLVLGILIVETPIELLIYYGFNTNILGMHLRIEPIMPSTCDAANMVSPKGGHLPCLLEAAARLKPISMGGTAWKNAAERDDMISLATTSAIFILAIMIIGMTMAFSPVHYPVCYSCGCRHSVAHFQTAFRVPVWMKKELEGLCKACYDNGASEKIGLGCEKGSMV